MKTNKIRMIITAVLLALTTATWDVDSDYIFDATTGTITKYQGWDTELVIPGTIGGKKVTAIGENAFKGGDLTSVIIPAGVVSIGKFAFQNNKIANLTLPEGLATIGDCSFENNSLTSLTIPAGAQTIG
jgi:hypothetical protein